MVAKDSSPLNICVFCSAAELGPEHTGPAREFAELIGNHGHALIWGGSDVGLMKVLADGVRRTGGKLIGISVAFLQNTAREDADEMSVTEDLSARKAMMLRRADAVAVLPGGTGTLDEVTEILELKKHGMHSKPVVVLNSGGFYEGLQQQLLRMEAEGFLPLPLSELVTFADSGEEAMRHLAG